MGDGHVRRHVSDLNGRTFMGRKSVTAFDKKKKI